ncbi:peptidyl-prolyl cis-trans isomerase [Thecamonas trahens ATCC 50062]|uniref:Peptidyl-prolyl cis-trans isomerase n=1 Tax=Thecamonas trahens ATCC 50062 TaxID=461836 RepID=A0A0L0D8I8_THETB|nr:peptidyl-prolyl cis-trans isomerase [Thecamonas trahens ATCC 50062]KNC48687.1 peptidyl-prolyl cis-trans isomerase [Thecamonas trahens ATCC 50062]|eukprot:XP_013762743.1 peptidyl-prolyl cis-trans isomerase [Thecamonas trahens ATCC 50062]
MSEFESSLPLGWSAHTSASHGKTYYFNEFTGETRWRRPKPAAPLNPHAPNGKVRVSHILAKHAGSRRAVARGEPVTRSLDEAKERIARIRDDIVAKRMTFFDAAYKYSDCSSSKRGGDVGEFVRQGQMQEAFANAAFQLELGELSDVVVSKSGVHIMVRTA